MVSTVSSMLNSSRAVDEFSAKLPEHIHFLVESLRKIILTSSGKITEQIKHKIPFYSYRGQLCYINPSEDKIILGFSRGAELPDEHKLLIGSGKTVRHLILDAGKRIDEEQIRNLIYEALIVNELKAEHTAKR